MEGHTAYQQLGVLRIVIPQLFFLQLCHELTKSATNLSSSSSFLFHISFRFSDSFSLLTPSKMLPHGLSKPEDMDAKSIISMQELDPSPVDDLSPDLESGEYFPRPEDSLLRSGNGSSISKLGLRGHRWDAWCM